MDIAREKGIWNGSWPLRELDNPHINHYLSCVIEREREEIVVEAERERERGRVFERGRHDRGGKGGSRKSR